MNGDHHYHDDYSIDSNDELRMMIPIKTISLNRPNDLKRRRRKHHKVAIETTQNDQDDDTHESTFQALFAEQTVREMQNIVNWWQTEGREERNCPRNALSNYYDTEKNQFRDYEDEQIPNEDGATSVSSFTTQYRESSEIPLFWFRNKSPSLPSMTQPPITTSTTLLFANRSILRKIRFHVKIRLSDYCTEGMVHLCEYLPKPFFYMYLRIYCHSTPGILFLFAGLLISTLGLLIVMLLLGLRVELRRWYHSRMDHDWTADAMMMMCFETSPEL